MKMKKTSATILALILVFALAACGGSTSETGGSSSGGSTNRNSDGGDAITSNADRAATPIPDDTATTEPAFALASSPERETVEFGGYEWRVLDVQDGKTLLLSEYILEQRKYHEAFEDVTWETCDLRAYLNGEFYNSFSDSDRAKIVQTRNSTEENPFSQWYGIGSTPPGGNDTDDYIFLLSLEEVVRYLGDSGQLANLPKDQSGIDDEYNEARSAYPIGTDSALQWWLRSPGSFYKGVAYILQEGKIIISGVYANGGSGLGIRPAMWVNL
jgi:hypothetical protein